MTKRSKNQSKKLAHKLNNDKRFMLYYIANTVNELKKYCMAEERCIKKCCECVGGLKNEIR